MTSVPTMTEPDAMATAPLANRRRTRRLVAIYAFLALLAVVIGVAVGVQRHGTTTIGSIAAPTDQSVIATAPPGVPTPTPLATKIPSPTPVPPTEAAPTPAAPTTPAVAAPVRSAPAVNDNQNGGGNGKGKGKGKGGEKGD